MTDPFRDRIAVVTGAGSGLGAAFATAFAARGARLILVDIAPDRLAEQTARLGDAVIETAVVDVADRTAMERFAAGVLERHGPPGILVNNAGVGHTGGIDDTTLDDWDWVLDINVRGVVYGCALFAGSMRRAPGRAHIVNIASAAGLAGVGDAVAYATSKGAVVALSESLATVDDTDRLMIHVVCPGFVPTRIMADGRSATPEGETRMASLDARLRKTERAPAHVAEATVKAIVKGRFRVVLHAEGRAQLLRRRLPDGLAFALGRKGAKRLRALTDPKT